MKPGCGPSYPLLHKLPEDRRCELNDLLPERREPGKERLLRDRRVPAELLRVARQIRHSVLSCAEAESPAAIRRAAEERMSSEGVSACGLTRSAESRAKDIASVIPAMNLAPGRGGMNEVLLAVDMASPAMNDAPKRVMRWSALS